MMKIRKLHKLLLFVFFLFVLNGCDEYNITLPNQETTTEAQTTEAQTTETTEIPSTGDSTTSHQETTETELSRELRSIYELALESGAFDGTYEEWLETVRGPQGEPGEQVLLRVSEDFIQWKYDSDETWMNLIALSELSGTGGYVISSMSLNESGELILTYSDGEEVNLGEINLKLTVNFYSGEELIYVEYVEHGSSANAPTPPEKEGYTFIGWDKTFVEVESDMNIYAEYQKNYYDITFDTNGGTEVSNLSDIAHGTTINMPIPKKIGHDFLGWFDGEKVYNDITKIKSDLILEAKWATETKLDYEFDEPNDTYTIIGYYGNQSHLVIPETLHGYPVTTINHNAIGGSDNLTKITIPSSITVINDGFVEIPNLEEIIIDEDNDVYYTYDNVLYSNKNELVLYPANRPGEIYNMPEEVVNIAFNAFSCVKNLRVINLSANLETFDVVFFSGILDYQFKIEEINIDDENLYFTSIDGVLYNKDLTKIIAYPINKQGNNYTVLSSVETIGHHAFEYNQNLTSIDLPDGLKHIEEQAFHLVNRVENFDLPESLETIGERAFMRIGAPIITIPKNVHTIGVQAFYHSHGNHSIIVDSNNPYYESKDGVLFNEDMSILIHYPCNNSRRIYNIPETVTTIKRLAFSYIFGLTYLHIPDSVRTVEESAFEFSGMLTILVEDSSIPTTWNQYWNNLSHNYDFNGIYTYILNIDGIKETSDYYYYLKEDGTIAIIGQTPNSQLTDLIIPETIDTYSVNEISQFAFLGNNNVVSITIPETIDVIDERPFDEANITLNLDDYETQSNWHELWDEGVIQINWGDEIRTITFNSNGGEPVEEIEVVYGTEITELPTPSRPGYTFIGWYLDGDKIKTPYDYKIHNDITLVAEWIDALDNGEFLYKVQSDDTVIIVGLSESNTNTDIIIPNTIDTYPVTIIGEVAFENNLDITSVTIPASVIEIEYHAFDGMSWLETVTFESGSNLQIIGDYAFADTSALSSINIPEGVTKIGDYAFSYAYSLETITLPSTLTTIGNNAFEQTWDLDSIIIPLAVTEMESNVFEGSSVLEIYCEVASLPETWATDWNPDEITVTWGYVDILDNGEFIYTLESDDTVTVLGLSESNVNTDIVIPNTIDTYLVTVIGKRAFENNLDITSVTIPSSVIEIEYHAFDGMSWLETVTFESGSNLQIIGDYAFAETSALSTMDIPEGVTDIGAYAFSYAYSLETITLPSTLTTIGNNAFEYTWDLDSIIIPLAVTEMGSNVLLDSGALEIYCEANSLPTTWATDWNPDAITVTWGYVEVLDNGEFLYRVQSDDTVIIVGLSESNVNTTIVIPNTIDTYPVTLIGKRAFENNLDITSITIPASVIEIEYHAFDGMSWLATVTIEAGSNLQIIGDYAFAETSALSTIDIPEGVTHIGNYAFSFAYSLTTITLPSTLTSIGDYAFEYTWDLDSITIPLAVTEMGSNVFEGSSVPQIYCEVASLPATWATDWNPDEITVTWGY